MERQMFKWLKELIQTEVRRAYRDDVRPCLRDDVRCIAEAAMYETIRDMVKPKMRVQIDDGAYLPERAHDTDAGADIRCMHDFTVPAKDSVEIGTGVHIELPLWTKAELVSKSGLNVKHCIQTQGLIDAGYSGEIRVRVYNHGDYDYSFKAGDKVTQLVVTDVLFPTFVQAESIEGGERGDAGFGSTGAR